MARKTNFRLTLQDNSPVILTFSLLCAGVLALEWLVGDTYTDLLFSVYPASLRDLLTYPRFVLHVLGHADWSHFLSNITLLLVIGPPLEERYGSRRLWWCIAITALISGVIHFILAPAGTALLGASGIVFMLILLSSLSGMSGGIPLTLLAVGVIYLGDEVYAALTQQDSIAQLTHIVGGVCGAVLGLAMRTKKF